jgi:hypothetical protein
MRTAVVPTWISLQLPHPADNLVITNGYDITSQPYQHSYQQISELRRTDVGRRFGLYLQNLREKRVLPKSHCRWSLGGINV